MEKIEIPMTLIFTVVSAAQLLETHDVALVFSSAQRRLWPLAFPVRSSQESFSQLPSMVTGLSKELCLFCDER
jgi:hypothetical protein